MGSRGHLSSLPLDVARAELLRAAPPLEAVERLPVEEALGRVIAERIAAQADGS